MLMLGTPGRNRTCDTWYRKPVLYPLSYGCMMDLFYKGSIPESITFARLRAKALQARPSKDSMNCHGQFMPATPGIAETSALSLELRVHVSPIISDYFLG
jgi:hypothetical protein